MSITAKEIVTGCEFDLGTLGKYTVNIENDAGTLRIVARYNGFRTSDVTPAGGHVEQRQLDSPTGFERV